MITIISFVRYIQMTNQANIFIATFHAWNVVILKLLNFSVVSGEIFDIPVLLYYVHRIFLDKNSY